MSCTSVCALTAADSLRWPIQACATPTTANFLYVIALTKITLDATPELQNKHTIFGRVAGTTIYNALALSEVELSTEVPDRPVYPPKLLRVEVVHNPFHDIVPRITREEKEAQAAARKRIAEERAQPEHELKRKKKNTALLSFGEEEEAAPVPRNARKPISSHDLLHDKKLSKKEIQRKEPTKTAPPAPEPVPEPAPLSPPQAAPKSKEVGKLEAAIQRGARSAAHDTKPRAAPAGRDFLASMVDQYRQKKPRKGESQTLSMLNEFRKNMRKADAAPAREKQQPTEVWEEEESMREYGASDDEDDGKNWREHRYVFFFFWLTQLRFGRHAFDRLERQILGARLRSGRLARYYE